MNPVNFPQANWHFDPPEGMELQVEPMPAWRGTLVAGMWDGAALLIVAHRPTDEERAQIAAGADIYISFLGHVLIPHAVNSQFPVELKPE